MTSQPSQGLSIDSRGAFWRCPSYLTQRAYLGTESLSMQLSCGFNTFFSLPCVLKVSGSYQDWQSQGKSPSPSLMGEFLQRGRTPVCAVLLWHLCKSHLSSGWIQLLKGPRWMLLEEGLSEKEKMALEAKSFPSVPQASLASLPPYLTLYCNPSSTWETETGGLLCVQRPAWAM